MATLYPEGCSYPYHRGMITPNPFSFRNIYSAIIAWLSHRLRIFSDFNIKAAFCQFFNNGFHLPFFIKIVFICCEKYKSQHIFITFYNIVLTVNPPFHSTLSSRFLHSRNIKNDISIFHKNTGMPIMVAAMTESSPAWERLNMPITIPGIISKTISDI